MREPDEEREGTSLLSLDSSHPPPAVAAGTSSTDPSRMLAYLVTISLCYDFMATLLTLAPYWAAVGGEPHLFGLVLGLYAAARGFGSLLFGALTARVPHAILLALCALLVAAGDLLYFSSSAFLPTYQLDPAPPSSSASASFASFGSMALLSPSEPHPALPVLYSSDLVSEGVAWSSWSAANLALWSPIAVLVPDLAAFSSSDSLAAMGVSSLGDHGSSLYSMVDPVFDSLATDGETSLLSSMTALADGVSGSDNMMNLPSGHWVPGNAAGGQALLLSSRLLAGVGSAGIVTVLAYLTEVSTADERVSVINRWRLALMLGNMISSVVSIALLYVGSLSVGPFLVDGFTSPVLVSMLLQLISLVACFFIRKVPPPSASSEADLSGSTYTWRFWKDGLVRQEGRDIVILNMCSSVVVLIFWLYYGQIIPICVFLYHNATDVQTLWYAYIPILVGAIIGMILSKKIPEYLNLQEVTIARVIPIFMGIGFVFLFKYTDSPPAWLYYTGMAILFSGLSTFFTVSRSLYTKVIERTRHVNLLLGVSFALNGVTTFIGSTIGSLLLDVELLDTSSSSSLSSSDSSSSSLSSSHNVTCGINYQAGSLEVTGCTLSGIDVLVGICTAATVVYMVVQWVVLGYVQPDGKPDYLPIQEWDDGVPSANPPARYGSIVDAENSDTDAAVYN